ncbi:MAG: hypothetical protein P8H31_06275 [Porticoccaceae bacterium]|nr:hypothetical protein [Porticoccaceae bacterium]
MSEVKSIVIPYRPTVVYVLVAVFAALMAGAFFFGKSWEQQILKDEMQEKARLEVEADKLATSVAQLQQQLSRVELNLQVDSAALESTRQEMIVLQKSIYLRDEELKLYRELLQDGSQPNGLSVADLKFNQLDDGRISYRWVARQKTEKMKTLSVSANFWISGLLDGKETRLTLAELDPGIEQLPLKMEFKYFSISRGVITLPDNFEPRQVRITLRYPWMEKTQFDKKYDWQVEG